MLLTGSPEAPATPPPDRTAEVRARFYRALSVLDADAPATVRACRAAAIRLLVRLRGERVEPGLALLLLHVSAAAWSSRAWTAERRAWLDARMQEWIVAAYGMQPALVAP